MVRAFHFVSNLTRQRSTWSGKKETLPVILNFCEACRIDARGIGQGGRGAWGTCRELRREPGGRRRETRSLAAGIRLAVAKSLRRQPMVRADPPPLEHPPRTGARAGGRRRATRCLAAGKTPPAAALTLGCESGRKSVGGRRVLLPVPVCAIHEGGGAVLSH